MAIALDFTPVATHQASGATSTTISASPTIITGGTNVYAFVHSASNQPLSITATCGGTAMTQIGSTFSVGGANSSVAAFYINNQTSGAKTVTATVGTPSFKSLIVFGFSGASTTGGPEVVTTVATGTSTSATQSITPLTAGSVLMDVVGVNVSGGVGIGSITAANGQTRTLFVDGTGATPNGGAAGYVLNSTTSATTLAYTLASSVAWSKLAFAVKPGAATAFHMPDRRYLQAVGRAATR